MESIDAKEEALCAETEKYISSQTTFVNHLVCAAARDIFLRVANNPVKLHKSRLCTPYWPIACFVLGHVVVKAAIKMDKEPATNLALIAHRDKPMYNRLITVLIKNPENPKQIVEDLHYAETYIKLDLLIQDIIKDLIATCKNSFELENKFEN
jgi:hypothetical protein